MEGIFCHPRILHEDKAPSFAILTPWGVSFCLWQEDGFPYDKVATGVVDALAASLIGAQLHF